MFHSPLSANPMYFHAQYRQATPNAAVPDTKINLDGRNNYVWMEAGPGIISLAPGTSAESLFPTAYSAPVVGLLKERLEMVALPLPSRLTHSICEVASRPH
jgi:hypothetical protein